MSVLQRIVVSCLAVAAVCRQATAFVSSSSPGKFSTATTSFVSMNRHHGALLKPGVAIPKHNKPKSSSSLQMVSAPGVAVAAITGAISGGLFSGSLHAIAGPDHLAALLPRCCGQRWYRAGRIGALWGMGHGVSATVLGVLAFGLKNRIQHIAQFQKLLTGASFAMEVAVGLSLILIGLIGIREAQEWKHEIIAPQPQSLSAAAADTGIRVSQKRAVIFNGLLHGFSWDGAPSLAPALAVATWRGNIAFLLAYAAGTMGAMAITTTLIGEGTRRAGEFFKRPDIPQKLSMFSSVVAMVIGVLWVGLALR